MKMSKLESIEIDKNILNNKEIIIKDYYECRDGEKVRKKYNISKRRFWKFIKQNAIINSSKSHTKFPLTDEKFLDNIDSEWKAYFLGFFYADGCLTKYYATLAITDKDILEQINKKIFSNRPIRIYRRKTNKNKTQYCISICNRHLVNKMREIGLHERKSLTIKFPDIIRNSIFLKDFIRGYFDGDGCIFFYKPKGYVKNNAYGVTLCVSKVFGNTLKNILKIYNIKSTLRKDSKSEIYILRLNRNIDIENFYNFVYSKDTEFFLNRKRVIFEQFRAEKPKNRDKTYSKHKGITFDKRFNKWYASFCVNRGNIKFIGSFNSEKEAYLCRINYLKENNLALSN